MEDEIKTFDASEDVVVEEVKPKRKYNRKKKEVPVIEEAEPKVVEEESIVAEAVTVEEAPAVEEAPVAELEVEEVPQEVEPVQELPSDDATEEPQVEEVPEDTPVEIKPVEKKQSSKKEPKTETIEASKDVKLEVTVDWDRTVNKFFIANKQISIFRAPNAVANGKPFKGRLQIVANTNDLFVKVRYVRSGLGATYGYARKSQIIQTGCKIG